MFLSSTFSISRFKFSSLTHLELIFVQDEGYGSNFHCQVSYSISLFPVFQSFYGRDFSSLIRFLPGYFEKLLWMRFFFLVTFWASSLLVCLKSSLFLCWLCILLKGIESIKQRIIPFDNKCNFVSSFLIEPKRMVREHYLLCLRLIQTQYQFKDILIKICINNKLLYRILKKITLHCTLFK